MRKAPVATIAAAMLLGTATVVAVGAPSEARPQPPNFTPAGAEKALGGIGTKSCSHGVVNGPGKLIAQRDTHLEAGPHENCDNGAYVAEDQVVWGWCWFRNGAGNRWFYGRKASTNSKGWIWDGEVKGDTSVSRHC